MAVLAPIDDDLTRRGFVGGTAAFAALFLAGCGSAPAPTAPDTGPINVPHAFGNTVLGNRPERVVTLGWGPTEAALAVGIPPIAIPRGTGNGGDETGLHPWVSRFLADHNLPRPEVLSTNASDAPPLEEIAALKPDPVLATEAGLTREQYDQLTRIAPTVAHPGEAWATPWRDVITISGAALGTPEQADQVLADLDGVTRRAALAHPEFVGRSITVAEVYDGQLLIYTAAEPRGQLLGQLGFSVDSYGSADPWYELSLEEAGSVTSDVLLMYHAGETERQAFETGPAASLMPQIAQGRVASVVGTANVAAVSPPTALSWPWTIDAFVATLAAAVRPS